MDSLKTLESQQLELGWWIEMTTSSPQCIYYFGPFDYESEARIAQAGYVEDLEQEGAQGIGTQIKHCQPEHLTIG